MDAGVIVTGAAALCVLLWGKGPCTRAALVISWCATMLSTLSGKMADVVATSAIMELFLAIYGLIVLHVWGDQRARFIAVIAMALMPAHFVMSASRGHFDWTVYAVLVNCGFCLQCAVATGGLDGLGRWIGRFRSRAVARVPHSNGGA